MAERDINSITEAEIRREFDEQCDSGFAPPMTSDEFIQKVEFVRYHEDCAIFRITCAYEVQVPLEDDQELYRCKSCGSPA